MQSTQRSEEQIINLFSECCRIGCILLACKAVMSDRVQAAADEMTAKKK